jgi:hypothetical protein
MNMARSRDSWVVAAVLGLMGIVGAGCGAVDAPVAAESSAVVSSAASEARAAAPAEAQPEAQAQARCVPGGHVNPCAFGQFCCNGQCVPFRPDVHCLGDGEGASE